MPRKIIRTNFTVSGGDPLSFSDSLRILLSNNQNQIRVSDALSNFVDNIQLISGGGIQITTSSDTLLLDSSVVNYLAGLADVDPEDELLITDVVAFLISSFLSISDSLTLSDLITLLREDNPMFNDSMSLNDSVSLRLENTSQDQSPADALTLNDNVEMAVGVSEINPYLRRYLNDES